MLTTGWLLFAISACGPKADANDTLGGMAVEAEVGTPCDPEIDPETNPEPDAACGEDLKCQYVLPDSEAEQVAWTCTEYGEALAPGDPCDTAQDCGPGLECAGIVERRTCAPEADNGGQTCAADGDCPSGTQCAGTGELQMVCARRCATDDDCAPGEQCDSYSVQWGGRIFNDLYTACNAAG